MPDPEVDEDEADELLRESLIEQGKDACCASISERSNAHWDERQQGQIVDGEDNVFKLPPADEGGCYRFRLSTTPRASSVLEAPSSTALEALVKFMRRTRSGGASAEEALDVWTRDWRLLSCQIPRLIERETIFEKRLPENVLSILLPRLVDDEGAEALVEPLSKPQQ